MSATVADLFDPLAVTPMRSNGSYAATPIGDVRDAARPTPSPTRAPNPG